MCKLGMISQEGLKIQVKLLLSANRKSYMPRQLAQQWMSLSDLEWHYPHRVLSIHDNSNIICYRSFTYDRLIL